MPVAHWSEEQIEMLLTTLESLDNNLQRIADSLERLVERDAEPHLNPAE